MNNESYIKVDSLLYSLPLESRQNTHFCLFIGHEEDVEFIPIICMATIKSDQRNISHEIITSTELSFCDIVFHGKRFMLFNSPEIRASMVLFPEKRNARLYIENHSYVSDFSGREKGPLKLVLNLSMLSLSQMKAMLFPVTI